MKPRKKERKVKSNQKQISHFKTARELIIGIELSMEGRSSILLMVSRCCLCITGFKTGMILIAGNTQKIKLDHLMVLSDPKPHKK